MIKEFLEAWLELPWKEALIELIGGMLYLSSVAVWLIIIMLIC